MIGQKLKTISFEYGGNTFKLADTSTKITTPLYKTEYYNEYLVAENETPEDVSTAVYGTPQYANEILIMNGMVDPVYDWYMSDEMLVEMVADIFDIDNKRLTLEPFSDEYRQYIHEIISKPYKYFQKDKYRGMDIETDSTDPNATPISRIDHYTAINDRKKRIKLINPNIISAYSNNILKRL